MVKVVLQQLSPNRLVEQAWARLQYNSTTGLGKDPHLGAM
jgi:hypothetical protein